MSSVMLSKGVLLGLVATVKKKKKKFLFQLSAPFLFASVPVPKAERGE